MSDVPVGDFVIMAIWLVLLLSFCILFLKKKINRKTIFDYLYRKRNPDVIGSILYYNISDKSEKETPSLFQNSKVLFSVILPVNFYRSNISNKIDEIREFFTNPSNFNQNINTYEIIVVNYHWLNNYDSQSLSSKPNVRVITINKSEGISDLIQIGSFASRGKYLLIMQPTTSIISINDLIQSYELYDDTSLSLFIPIRINSPDSSFLQKLMSLLGYVDTLADPNFDSFMITKPLAKLIFENIHCSDINSFDLEMRIISKQAKAKIIEIPVNEIYRSPPILWQQNLKNKISMITLIIATFFGIYQYSYRTPINNSQATIESSDSIGNMI